MTDAQLEWQLKEAEQTIRGLQQELAETDQGLLALTLELEQRLDERTTELRAAHEELQKTNSEVLQSTLELQTAYRELEAFSYTVSHDLRSPLRAIDGFSTMLMEDHADKLDDKAKRLLTSIRRNTHRMNQLINDVLAFSRVSRQEIRTTAIQMEELVHEVLQQLVIDASNELPRFEIGELAPAVGDRTMVGQVLINLISNAVKFTRSREAPIIKIGGRAYENQSLYYIQDNGVGFDTRYADKLFGVFQRLHSEREFEGTGVGLAIVRQIVNRHGGRVWAESILGQGATFYFTLPKASTN